MKTVSFLSLVAASVAVHANYLPSVATGYIYRSDNNGPASLIQLGNNLYQQPQAFAPPFPLQQQLLPLAHEAYDLAAVPVPLPYISSEPIAVINPEDHVEDTVNSDDHDDYLENSDGNHGHGHTYEKGSGSDYSDEHHAAHGEKGSKGYKSNGYHAKGAKGHYGKKHNEGHFNEGEGKKSSHHDESESKGDHHQANKHHKGADHGHKKHHSAGEEITGYHKVFNKDEFKKDHDFYDVADNSGHFNKHGYHKANHGSEEGAQKEGANHDSGYEKGEAGKAGYHSKEQYDESDANHSAEESDDAQHAYLKEFGKKSGSSDEKEYAFSDDDEDDSDYEDDDY